MMLTLNTAGIRDHYYAYAFTEQRSFVEQCNGAMMLNCRRKELYICEAFLRPKDYKKETFFFLFLISYKKETLTLLNTANRCTDHTGNSPCLEHNLIHPILS